MNRGKLQLLTGNSEAATRSFASAQESFAAAVSGAGSPWLRVIGWVPILGRTPHAVSAIAAAGVETAQAGVDLARAVNDLGGLGSLAPTAQGIPVGRLQPLTDAFRKADALTGEALDTLAHAPGSLLLGPVRAARLRAEDQIRSIHALLHTGSLLLGGLPDFLGENGTRRYFFGAQNPAELRGTGGLIGAYSILTLSHGHFRFSKFLPIQSLPLLSTDQVAPPNADYARNYDQFRGGKRFWTAINVTPDFPSAAGAIENAYEKATGVHVDGVITADPFTLAALLKVTGPAVVPGLNLRVRASNVVAFTTNEAYALFHDSATRKLVLGSVAKSVFEQFLARGKTGLKRMRILAKAASEGHIHVFSNDPTMEAGLARTGMGGALTAPPGDFLSVVVNSSAGDKVDYFQSRSVTYSVRLGDNGTANADAHVTLVNNAPTTGQPRYVIGPILKTLAAGDSVPLLHVYCDAGSRFEGATRNGSTMQPGTGTDLGYRFYEDYFTIPSRSTADVGLSWWLPHAWTGNSSGGTYRLTFLNQTTIRPTQLRVEIQLPGGMHVVNATASLRVQGDTVVWQGVPGRELELRVSFQPSLPLRLWRNVTRFLSKPVIRF